MLEKSVSHNWQKSIKLCWFSHPNHYQELSSSWEETIAQKCGVLSINVIGGVRRKDSCHQTYCIYRMINDDNKPTGRETFEVPGFVFQKRWYQILLTCAAKPQTKNRNEALQKAECILIESGRSVLFLEAQSDEDIKAQLGEAKHFVGNWLHNFESARVLKWFPLEETIMWKSQKCIGRHLSIKYSVICHQSLCKHSSGFLVPASPCLSPFCPYREVLLGKADGEGLNNW